MKTHHRKIVAGCLVWILLLGICAGCRQLLLDKASPTSLPVVLGAATTNDPNAVALLELARAANAHLNATPTGELIDKVFAGMITLVSAGAGFYARHQVGKSPKTQQG